MRPTALRVVGAVTGFVVAQVAWAIWRPLPSFADLDPSGWEGPESGRPLRLVVLGDSSCTGSGLRDPADVWVRVLARRLGDLGFRVEVHSVAVGGSKARDLVTGQLDDAVAIAADVALVSVGGNDALRGVPLVEFERSLDLIVSRLAEVTPVVALSGVGDMGTVPRLPTLVAMAARRRGRALDAIHRRVAARHGVLVADQWEWAAERFRDPRVFAEDLFHPNPEGHRVWAEVAFDLLAPVLARTADTALPEPGDASGSE